MEWAIPEEIVRSTRCDKGFPCLAGKTEGLCQVEFAIGDDVLLVRPVANQPCPYKTFFRESFSCECPVRREIYHRYRY